MAAKTAWCMGVLITAGLVVAATATAEVVVSNVRAQQLADGTRRVEVLYDLAGAPAGGATVSVAFSATGAAPYSITPVVAALSGHVGAGVANGSDKRLVWDCTLTLPAEAYGTTYRAAVTAVDPGGGDQQITITLAGGVQLVLVKIPAGTFTMGSPDSERGRDSDEGPQFQVTITQAYYLGRTEVTQAQWQAVMGTAMPTSCGSYGTGSDYPVYCVSWNDICGGATGSSCSASSFIGRLNQQQGTTEFRLPTESEWEHAARGGTTTEFSFAVPPSWDTRCGSLPAALPYMWWCNNAGPTTHPVGQKLANPFGLFDMHGNVWESLADWYGRSYPSSAQTDPQGPGSGARRALRGGGWYDPAEVCRSAVRGSFYQHDAWWDVGFRLARSSSAGGTAHSSQFTIDLLQGAVEPVLQALDVLEAAAVARVDADRDALADSLTYLVLVMDGGAGAQAVRKFVDNAPMTADILNVVKNTVAEGSKAGGAAADLAGGLVANLLVNEVVGAKERAQLEYFRAVLEVLDSLRGTHDLAAANAAIRLRLDQDFEWGGSTLGFAAARDRINARVGALRTALLAAAPPAGFPASQLAALVGLSAQGLRDSTGREAPLCFFDGAALEYALTLSGNASRYAAAARRLYESDKAEQSARYWRAVGLDAETLGKGVVALLTAAPTGGASLGVWAISGKTVATSRAIGATESSVAHAAANLENDRLAALYAFDALDTVLGELSAIDDTFKFRTAGTKVMLPAIDALVRAHAQGTAPALDGYGLTVEGMTLPSMVFMGANGLADAEGTLTLRNSGTRPASPSPLLVVSSWNRESYERVAVGALDGRRSLAPGEQATFTWRSSAVAFSVVPSNVDLTLGFGPQLVRVGYGAADVTQFLVLPPDTGAVAGSITQVPVGAGTASGSTVSYSFQPQAASKYVTFTLGFAFGDLDLHVYDGEGGHRGMDYSTGEVEKGLPGEGPDPRGNPESIRVPVTPGVTYRVEVVDRTNTPSPGPLGMLRRSTIDSGALAATADNAYRVSAVEEGAIGPILEVSPRQQRVVVKAAAAQAVGTISLLEIGLQAGVSSLAVAAGALTGAGGETIPAGEVAIELGAVSLQPGENATATFRVPLAGRSAFPYSGEITVTSSAGTQLVAVTVAQEASRIRRRPRR